MKGAKGVKGKGSQGVKGAKEVRGQREQRGAKGGKGVKGVKEAKTAKGVKGSEGAKGAKGRKEQRGGGQREWREQTSHLVKLSLPDILRNWHAGTVPGSHSKRGIFKLSQSHALSVSNLSVSVNLLNSLNFCFIWGKLK